MEWPVWPDASPSFADLPFARSDLITGLAYLNATTVPSVSGTGADTWYPSQSGNAIYSSWTDGGVNYTGGKFDRPICYPSPTCASSCGPCAGAHGDANNGSFVQQGFARAVLDTPSSLPRLVDAGVFNGSSALPYQGRYPSGSLFHRGVWYYGTYTLAELWGSKQYPCKNWCVLGPFVGFRHSLDRGKTWVEPRPRMADDFASYRPSSNLFGELGPQCIGRINNTRPHPTDPCAIEGNAHDCSPYTCVGTWRGKVKFGAPHVADLGAELVHSPDGSAYVLGHGASAEREPHSWMQGSEVYLARTTRPPDMRVMSDGRQWEYYAGRSLAGKPRWAASVAEARPLLRWENKTGAVTLSYVKALRRYVMAVGCPSKRSGVGAMFGPMDFYLLESTELTGPYRLVSYQRAFGPQAYFVSLPTFAMGDTVETDEHGAAYLEARLSYSANYAWHGRAVPAGSGYAWDLLRVRLLLARDWSERL